MDLNALLDKPIDGIMDEALNTSVANGFLLGSSMGYCETAKCCWWGKRFSSEILIAKLINDVARAFARLGFLYRLGLTVGILSKGTKGSWALSQSSDGVGCDVCGVGSNARMFLEEWGNFLLLEYVVNNLTQPRSLRIQKRLNSANFQGHRGGIYRTSVHHIFKY